MPRTPPGKSQLAKLARAHKPTPRAQTPRKEDYIEVIYELIHEKGYAKTRRHRKTLARNTTHSHREAQQAPRRTIHSPRKIRRNSPNRERQQHDRQDKTAPRPTRQLSKTTRRG